MKMKIESMRFIDYWLGRPICFLLSGLEYILKMMLWPKKKITKTKKILLTELSEMGAIILSYPLMKQIRKDYSDAEIFFLTFKKNEPVFEVLNTIQPTNVLTIRDDTIPKFIYDVFKTLRKLRKERMDMVIDLELFSRFSAILSYLTGAKKRLGFYRYAMEGLYQGNLYTHRIQYNALLHISQSYLSLGQSSGQEAKLTPELSEKIEANGFLLPQFIPSGDQKKEMKEMLQKFGINDDAQLILINPGEGTIPLREWPLDKFILLSKKILENENTFIILVGTETDAKKAESLCQNLSHQRCVNMTNKTQLPQLLTLMDRAKVLITNDGGLAHLASLTPIKKLIIFGPESPKIYAPLGENNHIIYLGLPCSPCLSAFNHRKSVCQNNLCLKKITVEDVYALLN